MGTSRPGMGMMMINGKGNVPGWSLGRLYFLVDERVLRRIQDHDIDIYLD